MTDLIERITGEEEQILRSWLSGNEVAQIARARRTDPGRIASAIDRLCNYDRMRARHILDTGACAPSLSPQAQDVDDNPPPSAQAHPPELEVVVRRRPDVPLRNPTTAVDELLARATHATVARVRILVDRIRRDAEELASVLDRAEAEEAARALVAARRLELEQAEAALRDITGRAGRHADGDGPSPATVRAWAKQHNVPCNPHGRVPNHIVDAYRAAATDA